MRHEAAATDAIVQKVALDTLSLPNSLAWAAMPAGRCRGAKAPAPGLDGSRMDRTATGAMRES